MDYTYFTFDNVSSSRYNLLVQNRGEDLLFPSQPSFENQIISPIYQGANYLAGVNKKERIFNFNCWVDSLATEVLREMLNWLSVDKIAGLTLDYNPNFSYKVKLNNISDFKHMAINEDGTSNYEFQISFVTIGNAVSESNIIYTLDEANLSSNVVGPNFDNGCPIGFTLDGEFKFLNYYSEDIPIFIEVTTDKGFSVTLNDKEYYNYELDENSSLTEITLDTQYGFCKIGNLLAESLDNVTANNNIGTMKIPSGDSKFFISDIIYWDSNTNIMQINNNNNIIKYLSEEISQGNLYVIVQDGSFGDNSTPGLPQNSSIVR